MSKPNDVKLLLGMTAIVALLMTSCGPAGPPTVAVTGTVTLDGTPVEGATVTFEPVGGTGDQPGQRGGQAVTDANGQFAMRSYMSGNEFLEGLTPGDYAVSIVKLESITDMAQRPKNLLPKKYADPKTSELIVELSESEAGGSRQVDLEL